ncbi:carboxypeptidase-like regulatory domain-containing protein [Methanolobus sp. WCC1]|uniref:carboxypeptidase regulatory-like domain-containing protein n=1 Tax=unclassified Methanolobus TaxID=2629569 RepID=UPI003246995A
MRKIILMALFFCLLVLPASADDELISNGNFSDGSTGWTLFGNAASVSSNAGYIYLQGAYQPSGFYQTVDLTNVDTLTYRWWFTSASGSSYVVLYIDGESVKTFSSGSDSDSIDVSNYTGDCEIKFQSIITGTEIKRFFFDDVSAIKVDSAISWDESTYSAGDIANITYNYPSYSASSENFIDIRSYNPTSTVWELEERRMVYSDSGSIQYVVPAYESRQFRAELMTRASVLFNPTEIGNATMQMTSEGAALEFTKYTYDRDENMTWNYYNMPEGSFIVFHSGPTAADATYFQQYSVSGNGSAGYQLPSNGPYGELFYIRAYDSDDNSLSYDYAYTENAPTGEATLHGRVRDASTEAVISGATVTVAGETTTTDSSGDYSITISKGTWDIEVSASNYVTKTVSDFTFSGSTYSYNPYLTPAPAASSTLYGSVSAADDGGSISQATVTVYNSTKTKSDVTHLGAFEINGLADGQTYTIKVTQDYFETYQDTFTFDAENNVLSIELTRASEETEEEDESGSSGGLSDEDDDSSSDDEYRPGRAAARGTLEQAEASIPGMFSVLMIIVFMAAIKKGLK